MGETRLNQSLHHILFLCCPDSDKQKKSTLYWRTTPDLHGGALLQKPPFSFRPKTPKLFLFIIESLEKLSDQRWNSPLQMSSGKTCNEVSQCLIVVVLVKRKRKKKNEDMWWRFKKRTKNIWFLFHLFFLFLTLEKSNGPPAACSNLSLALTALSVWVLCNTKMKKAFNLINSRQSLWKWDVCGCLWKRFNVSLL